MKRFLPLAALLLSGLPASAQQSASPLWSRADMGPPFFTADKVQPSNADRAYPLVPGSFVSIYGGYLGPNAMCSAKPDTRHPEATNPAYQYLGVLGDQSSYPTKLCEVQVLVNGVPAGVLYVQERQINFKMPPDTPAGYAQLQVVYGDQSSATVTVPIAAPFIDVSLSEPAYVGMPIWISLSFAGRPVGEYPVSLNPSDIGCADIQVRRDGTLLPKIPEIHEMSNGAYVGPACGFVGVPGPRSHPGGFPLHLLYRFDEPGTYQVKYISKHLVVFPRSSAQPAYQAVVESEWTPITVQAPQKDQRTKWLAEMAAKMPSEPAELLSDFLPSVLGVPDPASLAIVKQFLNHPNELVRRYAMAGMRYWPEDEVHDAALELLQSKGLSDVIADLLLTNSATLSQTDADQLVQDSLPYLQSSSLVLLRGALFVMRGLVRDGSPLSPDLRIRAEKALMDATEQVIQTANGQDLANRQTLVDFASLLGTVRDARAHEILWNLFERHIAAEQVLVAISWRANQADLPKLGELLQTEFPGDIRGDTVRALPYALIHNFGDDAVPYVERALQGSSYPSVKMECARQLMHANRPAGFAFALNAIQGDPRLKAELIGFLRDYFPELHSADEAAIIAFLKKRAP